MRRLVTVVCVALALAGSGCTARRAAKPVPVSALVPEVPSRGSAKFGSFVRAREPQLQFCYREARAASPELAGSATVAVTLAADGSVLKADIVRRAWSGRGSDDVERCLLSRVRVWKFPPTDAAADEATRIHSFAVIFTG